MNKETDSIQKIDEYLSGSLNDQEREAFEKNLQFDDKLKTDVIATQKVIEGVEGYAFRESLKNYHKELFEKKKPTKQIQLYYTLAIAASVSLIVIVFYLNIFQRKTDYHSFFKAYPGPVTTRGESSESPIPSKALDYYEQGQFDHAVAQFEENSASGYSEEIRFYQALSYIGNNQPEKALPLLKNLDAPQYSEQITWYTAICYLFLHDQANASALLKTIDKGEFEYDNAQAILKTLN